MPDKEPVEVELRPMESGDIEKVYAYMGMLNQHQSNLFENNGVLMEPPAFDLQGYDVHMICARTAYMGKDYATVGLLLTRPSDTFIDTYGIADLVIEPAARNHGIGCKVLEKVQEHAKEHGFQHLSLNVHTDNEAAVKLYTKFGFQPRSMYMMKVL